MQHNIAPAFPPSISDPTNGNLPFNLDPFTAKQMAALQATSLAKAANRSAPGGTSASYFGGMSNPLSRPDAPHDTSSFHPLPHPDPQAPIPPGMNPAQAQQNPAVQQQMVHHQRKRNWLNGLATLMVQRGTPLPPQLTGVPFPSNYDPANMPWKSLEVSSNDIGVVRLAGKDVDLYKLWGLILQAGGGQKVSQKGAWPLVLQQFDLPEAIPSPNNPVELQPTAPIIERYYTALLGPFEEAYRKNMMEQSQRAALAGRMPGGQPGQMNPQARQGGMPGMPGQNGLPNGGAPGMNMMPQGNVGQSMDGPLPGGGMPTNGASHPAMNGNGMPMGKMLPGGFPGGAQNGSVELEHELESRKRKMQEAVESDAKRVRQKTGGSDVSESRSSVAPPASVEAPVAPVVTRTIRQPSRRKIEYVPFAREVDTAGGRDLELIQSELLRMGVKGVRRIEEWGQVDLEAVTLSLRSRVSTEMSYALTTFTLLTLMRGSTQGGGFPIAQAPELLDEMVDLMEDLAFDGAEDEGYPDDSPIVTHRELMNSLVEDGSKPFAALANEQGARDPDNGPRHRPAEVILVVLNIIRNLSSGGDNQDYLAKHEKLLPVLLRMCALAPATKHTSPLPLAPALSLADLLSIRKDVMYLLLNISFHIHLSPTSPSKEQLLTVRRAFEVIASYLVDVTEAISPFQWILQTGIPPAVHQPKPPALADMALDTFSRFTLPDDNRQAVSKAVPQSWLWALLEAIVHRLPVADNDFQVIMRDVWLTYVERLIMSLYSLAFLAPPAVKERAKRDRALGFAQVMMRLVKKFTVHAPPELRHHFAISVRRAVEALKVVDDAEDSFDVGNAAAAPTLAFGMGYGEQGDARVERGMGMLSGYQEDITLGLMMHPDLLDALLFSELESLVRVGR